MNESICTGIDEAMKEEMEYIGTPHNIVFLLHCYTSPSEVFERISAPVMAGTIAVMKNEGLIVDGEKSRTFEVTEKGKFLVDELCSTPIPKTKYYIDR